MTHENIRNAMQWHDSAFMFKTSNSISEVMPTIFKSSAAVLVV